MHANPVIEQRPDERGMLVYVIMQNGRELTSRWTRADAEDELQRLTALPSPSADMPMLLAAE